MKRQINAYRGHGEIAVEGHNIKLGRGGIREIEFFAQTQQLIAGGRNPALRDRDTLTTLDKLGDDRWIDEAARDDMKAAYVFLRTVEHRLQMVNDEQTQTLPAERAELERFARFLGLCRPRRLRQGAARASRQGAAPLFAPVRKGARRRQAGTGVSARRRRPQDAGPAGRARLPRAAGSLDDRPALACAAAIARSRARWRAAISRRCCRSCSSSWRAPTTPTPRWCCSTISSPICTARRGCCRCCGKIPI